MSAPWTVTLRNSSYPLIYADGIFGTHKSRSRTKIRQSRRNDPPHRSSW